MHSLMSGQPLTTKTDHNLNRAQKLRLFKSTLSYNRVARHRTYGITCQALIGDKAFDAHCLSVWAIRG